jgi:hypothetical protein
MKDYIVTVEETCFDATKFDFNKFYIVIEKDVEYKCLLKTVEKDKVTFITIIDGEYRKLYILPWKVKNGSIKIKEVETLDEVVPLSKAKTKYWDLYRKDAEMKVGKCYEIKIGEHVFKGFCSHKDSIDIIMVLYSDTGTIGAISYDPSTFGKYNDNITLIRFPSEPEIIHSSLTSGVVVKINRDELKEDRVYFKELI